ncbi:DUF1203 domain-containing protein [Paremcibacter congregatus]|jgi:hypothetical protein|uniref:DUF1203 domain-containing protein n=1 Tax=Paremcibacter congregatus TaxID=2043170 RepID=UPI003A9446F1
MSFIFNALDDREFSHLYGLSDAELAAQGVVTRIADSPSFPCRVTLEGARIGERVLLLNHTHLDVNSPYRASYAIYVRDGAKTRRLAPGELPDYLQNAQIALRAFDQKALLVAYKLTPGSEAHDHLDEMLAQPEVTHVDVHFAGPGCYFGRVTRCP